jgi:hypothetical protein
MIVRSYFVPDGSRAGLFQGDVAQFMGLCSMPGGFAILTACNGAPRPRAGILLPSGQQAVKSAPKGEPSWRIHVVLDEEGPPPATPGVELRCLGGVNSGSAVVFVFVERVA